MALRRTRATAWQISAALGPTFDRHPLLARAGLNRVALLEPPEPVQRYEWPHAGDLLHVDLKRLGRIAGIGHRIHGDRRARARGVGWEFLHVAIDDATRLAYVEVLAADTGRPVLAFSAVRSAGIAAAGIRVRRLLTDNGMAYRAHVFAGVCRRWAVRHRFTRPYRPQTNGKAERLIQTLLRDWAYRFPYRTSARRTAALRPLCALLQSPASTREPGASVALDAFPRGCLMNNLFDSRGAPGPSSSAAPLSDHLSHRSDHGLEVRHAAGRRPPGRDDRAGHRWHDVISIPHQRPDIALHRGPPPHSIVHVWEEHDRHEAAMIAADTASSAMPFAALPMMLAVAGITIITPALSETCTCPIGSGAS